MKWGPILEREDGKKRKKSILELMKLGGKHLLWSSCASHLGADYYFFSAHVGMCMHKVAAGWEVGPMEGVGGGGIWGAWGEVYLNH